MYSELYSLFSEGLFDGALTALQSNTIEVIATLGTILVGLVPLLVSIKIILHFFDF